MQNEWEKRMINEAFVLNELPFIFVTRIETHHGQLKINITL